jgi:hypothetical protein
MHGARRFASWLSIIRGVNANGVDIAAVWKLWNFIIAIRSKRTLASPVKDIRGVGNGSRRSWINA